MTVPVKVYTVDSNGQRRVTLDGGVSFRTSRTAAQVGTHDVRTIANGQRLISIAGNLPEPLDIAEALGKL
jgi:ATP-dependent protease HslVU (ClpYQ) peptidase subunit